MVEQLGIDNPAVVFNGAALWCPSKRRLIEERVLSERTLARLVKFGTSSGLMTVAMCDGAKFATSPRDDAEASALRDMTGVHHVEPDSMLRLRAMRVTFFSQKHATSDELAAEVERTASQPVYITHFPLNCLPPPPREQADRVPYRIRRAAARPRRCAGCSTAPPFARACRRGGGRGQRRADDDRGGAGLRDGQRLPGSARGRGPRARSNDTGHDRRVRRRGFFLSNG